MATFSQAWLEDTKNNPGIIVEIGYYDGTEKTLLLSNFAALFSGYAPVITSDIVITENFDAINISDVEILNPNGEYDVYLTTTYIFTNRTINVWVGDRTATSVALFKNADEGLVFSGVIADIDSRSRGTINFKARDKMERLNSAVSETLLGTYGTWGATSGGQTNKEELIPLVFGEVCNITPMLIDPSTLEYQVCLPPVSGTVGINGVIELRDNGMPIYTHADVYPAQATPRPVGATITETTGKFKLLKKLAGTLTASVQGVLGSISYSSGSAVYTAATYNNSIASLVGLLATQYGKVSTRLTLAELDATNLQAFSTSNTQSVGIYLDSRANVIEVISQLAAAVGATPSFNRQGKLGLYRLGTTITGPNVTTINDSHILLDSFEIVNRREVSSSHTIGFCQNYTTQENLLTGIPDSNKTLFTKNMLESVYSDTTTTTNYKLEKVPEVEETVLIDSTEAQTEAIRRTNLTKNPLVTYSFTGFRRALGLVLGQSLSITHNRFGFSGGVTKQVVGLANNWTKLTSQVEVM